MCSSIYRQCLHCNICFTAGNVTSTISPSLVDKKAAPASTSPLRDSGMAYVCFMFVLMLECFYSNYYHYRKYPSSGRDNLVVHNDCHDNDIFKMSRYTTLTHTYPSMPWYLVLPNKVICTESKLTLNSK